MQIWLPIIISYAKAYYQQVKKAFPDPNLKDPVGQSGAWWWGILEIASEENNLWAPLEGTLPSASEHWHYSETRKH